MRFLQESWKQIRQILPANSPELEIGYLLDEMPCAIDQSLEGVVRVSKIIRAMRDFSHPASENKVATDINRAIETTIAVATSEWKYVADVQTDLDPRLPAVVCLPSELHQVLLNLLVNAAHAAGEVMEQTSRKGRIRFTTSVAGDCVEIRVSDTGAGIPEEHRGKIFEPFFTTKEVGKGTGQGLAIAHSVVVQQHNGKIWFETEVGRGTTFII